ncbi:lipoprotein [Companilactobacillus crustorum]|uniref:Lipoprotein n=4 Tax=Companilactobacillus TaxID=2767879 RepID=A0A837RFT5_9LACO|nr:lipoprotein [Companilactobacillus crustorum JCM 15951]KRO19788.1 lipoprotein [Companilactobacillus crustorum]
MEEYEMKKALLLVTTGLALVLAGCSNSSSSAKSSSNDNNTYNSEMTKGNNAVDDKNYSKAADHFESAVKAKKTSKASASEKQANNLVKGKKLMNQRQFSDAKSALNAAKNQENGNSKMTKRAKTLLSQVKKIQLNRNNFKMDIKNAKSLIKSGNNDQARSLLEQVTKFKGVKGKYYSDLYTQANTLLQSLPETSANSSTDTNSNTDTNNNSSNSSTDTNSSTSSSDDQSDNPAAKGDFDVEKKEVGGKAITDQDIANARQQLTDQGVKTVGAWSDNDIIRAIKNAHADGRTTIKPSDAKVRN